MNLFEHEDYRVALKWAAELWKKARPGRTYLKLSQAGGVHAPYFSNVLKEKAHLSSDQLFAILQYMGHAHDEMEYMLLLLEQDKCVLDGRKKALRLQLQKIKEKQEKTESSLKVEVIAPTDDYLSRYYLDNTIRLVYAFMGIPDFANNPQKIAESLNFSEKTVQEAIVYLLDVKLIERDESGRLQKTKTQMHLPRQSHLFEAQRKLFLYRCLEHQDRTRNSTDYNFGVTFSATSETKEKIKKKFLEFLNDIQPLVNEAEAEEVFQMNFDLFNWSS